MNLTLDERTAIADSIKMLEGLIDPRYEETGDEERGVAHSRFVRLLRDSYLSESGLGDLLQETGRELTVCHCGQTCVQPCASVCVQGRSNQ
jgi:hypothetical protein